MHVLLVDDDRFVVDALRKKIDWAALAVTEVLAAYNACQAKKAIEDHMVEICICDIEMPGESGLDLLAWVREKELDVQFIFLTSYADFHYAQRAIGLSSLDYLLKPIDFGRLSHIVGKAVKKLNADAALHKIQVDSKNWQSNYQNIVNLFWKNLFLNPLLTNPAILETELKKKDLPYQCGDFFLPVLFKLYQSSQSMKTPELSLVDFSFCNITSETLQDSFVYYEALLSVQPYEYILLIRGIRLEEVRTQFSDILEILFTNLRSFFLADIACGVSSEVPMTELPDTVERLRAMREENLSIVNTPLFLKEYTAKEVRYTPPSLDIISTFLEQKQPQAALEKLESYLHGLSEKKELNKETLLRLRLDMEQIVFAYLHKAGIEANTLYCDPQTDRLLSKSLESAAGMMEYLRHLIIRGVDCSSFIKKEDSVIDIIRNYIHQHYAEDITRTMLAELVYLNPDYMARLFKKQMHTSIVNYITGYRMQKAKELLKNPAIPVTVVAARVGYGNYSYFSKLFKDTEGCTPNEYRKKESYTDAGRR